MNRTAFVSPVTWVGLALALFGAPLVVQFFHAVAPPGPLTDPFVLERELSVFAVAGLLLWLIVKGEKLGVESIGLRFRDWGQSLLWGLVGLAAAAAAIAVVLLVFSLVGLRFGEGTESGRYQNVSLWVMLIVVVRAGTVEEICYRGYVIERLQKITGHWLGYFLAPLLVFAAFHFRQGLGGIVISFVAGAVLAALYLYKRDLKANILAHFLIDFIPNVLFPLLSGGSS